ncbi:hypothetical protein AgCh_029706 [Apium graveolens]
MASVTPAASTQVMNLLLLLLSVLFIISLFQLSCHDNSSLSPSLDAVYSVRRFLLLQGGYSGVRGSPSRKGPGGHG